MEKTFVELSTEMKTKADIENYISTMASDKIKESFKGKEKGFDPYIFWLTKTNPKTKLCSLKVIGLPDHIAKFVLATHEVSNDHRVKMAGIIETQKKKLLETKILEEKYIQLELAYSNAKSEIEQLKSQIEEMEEANKEDYFTKNMVTQNNKITSEHVKQRIERFKKLANG